MVNAPAKTAVNAMRRACTGLALASQFKEFYRGRRPLEVPDHPELFIETGKERVEECAARIFARLEELGDIEPEDASDIKKMHKHSTGV